MTRKTGMKIKITLFYESSSGKDSRKPWWTEFQKETTCHTYAEGQAASLPEKGWGAGLGTWGIPGGERFSKKEEELA